MRLAPFLTDPYGANLAHWCSGCGVPHRIPVDGRSWDGNAERPTVHHTVRHFVAAMPETPTCRGIPETTLCSYVVRRGALHFGPDCRHGLAGQSIEQPGWPESPVVMTDFGDL